MSCRLELAYKVRMSGVGILVFIFLLRLPVIFLCGMLESIVYCTVGVP